MPEPAIALTKGLLDGPTPSGVETLATQLRTAFNARDIHNRAEIIAHVKRLLDEGVRASITETNTGPRGVACLLEVEWPDPENAPPDRYRFYQVYVVTDGLVTEIQGHDDQDSALAAISN